MIPTEWIQQGVLNWSQSSFIFAAIGIAMVAREKRPLGYLMVLVGSFISGWLGMLCLLGVSFFERLHRQSSPWLSLATGLGWISVWSAAYSPESMRGAFLLIGVALASFHFSRGGAGIWIAVALVHQYYPQGTPEPIQIEWIMGAAACYLAVSEGLRVSKMNAQHQVRTVFETMLSILVLGAFWPVAVALQEQAQENPEMITPVLILAFVFLMFSAVMYFKKVDFKLMQSKVSARGARWHRWLYRSLSENQNWIKQESRESLSVDEKFTFFFWMFLVAAAGWMGFLWVFERGYR